uniref:cAMP-dependent protein kinase n=1 Tax=Graphocephala atropunctata TaxID=36148 RepID=A0A1B6KDU0_9HEMI
MNDGMVETKRQVIVQEKVSTYCMEKTPEKKHSADKERYDITKLKKSTKQSYVQLLDKLQSIGPLQIVNLNDFLAKSKMDFEYFYRDQAISDLKISDFKIIRKLGEGGFGKVVLAEIKSGYDDTLYAIKVIDKKSVVKQKVFTKVYNEKKVLQSLNFPFVVYLKYFFIDFKNLYFVMPFVPGGDFLAHLTKHFKLSESHAKFYMSQLVLALEYLHYLGLIHRDVKPENIMIDAFGYIKLADYGLCIRCYGNDRAWSMAGTEYFMAPEMMTLTGYDSSVDWWALGVTIYVVCAGDYPFYDINTNKLYELILTCTFEAPKTFSKHLKHLIRSLLVLEPEMRIANPKRGAIDLKAHKWFRSMDWLKILNRTVQAPYIPRRTSK